MLPAKKDVLFCLVKLLAAGFLEVSGRFAHNSCLDFSCEDRSSTVCTSRLSTAQDEDAGSCF